MPLQLSAPFALFDDNLAEGGDLLLDDLLGTHICHRAADLDACFAAIEAARVQGHWVALTARYELGYAMEPRLAPLLETDGHPLLTAWVFRNAHHLDTAETSRLIDTALTKLDQHARLAAVSGLQRGIDRDTYCADVQRIRDWITAGDCYQVNYTFPLHGHCSGHPLALYKALRTRQPVQYGACVLHADGALLSRSPELFVERHGTRLTCRPMKGTAPRDADPRSLSASEKDRAENVMIVDLIRNDLGRLTPAGGVRVDSLFDIEAYPSLWQMTSSVSAEPVQASLLEVFRALFPCGSITGAPKIRAMEIIAALEHSPRGVYCGALGWLAPNGDFRFSVPIRTLEMQPGGHFRCGLGSGIVADSQPENEWEECLLKGRFLTGLEAPFGLIETLRCEAGPHPVYPLLERHLQRLSASAAHFGIPCDTAVLRSALHAHAITRTGLQRVRLELHPDGRFDITGTALTDTPEPVTLGLAAEHVRSDDPLLRHKTTARQSYDQASREAEAAGLFDLLFFNERDELTEGARSSVFIEGDDGVLQTPPLESGALDGVMRRELLASGRAREAVISREALLGARAIYVANALRGLLRAELRADLTPASR